ncbi:MULTISPECIES: hypothetical protein [unclassified Porphyromonas]|nr:MULTISPECIES: hypothetical protein [unclassified Porphyromonas]
MSALGWHKQSELDIGCIGTSTAELGREIRYTTLGLLLVGYSPSQKQ